MHFEEYYIDQESADTINEVKARGRIVAVGTTSTRTLESAAVKDGDSWKIKAGHGNTDIHISWI